MRLNIRQVFPFILFIALFAMTLRPIADADFWWHLRTGQLITETHSIPHTDPFSFTAAGKTWVAHEWLSEVFMYFLYRLGGYGLLIFTFSSIITLAFLLAYLRSPGRPYAAGFAILLGALATAPTWGVRPQMLSLLLTSLFLFLLDRYRAGHDLKILIPLPFLTLLWVNLHAGYLLGLVMIGLYFAGEAYEYLLGLIHRRALSARPLFVLGGSLALCLLIAPINPNGLRILTYPFETLTSQSMQQFIQEWFSPDFHRIEWQALAMFLLALIGAGMLGKKTIAPTNILLALIFGYAALRSARNVPLFIVAAAPVLAEQASSFFEFRSEVRTPNRLVRWALSFLLACILLAAGARFVQVIQGQSQAERDQYPSAAVDWILENRPEGNLYNTYGWGGYLIWRLYPEYKTYIDGRADVYGDQFIYDYLRTYHGQPGWEATLEEDGVHLALLEPGAGLANALRQSSGWEVIYEDKLSVLFRSLP